MKNEMKDGKLNIYENPVNIPDPSMQVTDSSPIDTSYEPTEDEIRAVEEMYLATLDAEVPDIWSRIEAGVNAEKSAVWSGQNSSVPGVDEDKDNSSDTKVISLADRKRKKKTWFAVIGAAAAILIVMVPVAMFGGTRNSKKSTKNASSERKKVSFTVKDAESDMIAGGLLDNNSDDYPVTMNMYGGEDGDNDYRKDELHGEVEACDTEAATEDTDVRNTEKNKDGDTLNATEAVSEAHRPEYQINSEGYIYISDGKVIFETLMDAKYEIANSEIFSKEEMSTIKGGGRLCITLKGDFVDGDEKTRSIIISEYSEYSE